MNEHMPKKRRIISQKHIQSAITNNRLSGGHVSDEMIKELIKILEDNPEKSAKEIIELALKGDIG